MWSAGASRLEHLRKDYQTHHHDHHQIVIGVQGNVVFTLPDGSEQVFSSGFACLLPSQCEHAFYGSGENRVLVVDVISETMDQGLIVENEIMENIFSTPCFITLDQSLVNLVSSLVTELERRQNDLKLQQYISGLLLHSIYHRVVSEKIEQIQDDHRINMQKINEIILMHLNEKLSVETLADVCHMSTSQFHLRFRQRTGQTPHQYILDKRVEQAAWLLQHSSMTIADVAIDSGFTTQSALSHIIKARFGISPGQMRKRYQSQ